MCFDQIQKLTLRTAILTLSFVALYGQAQISQPSVSAYPQAKIWIAADDPKHTNGWLQVTAIAGFMGKPVHWTTYVHSAYIPSTGNSWAGAGFGWGADPRETKLALIEDRLVGLYFSSFRIGGTLGRVFKIEKIEHDEHQHSLFVRFSS